MNKEYLNKALIEALNYIRPEIVEYLLSKGADANARVPYGDESVLTALIRFRRESAQVQGRDVDEIIEHLIKYGAKE